MTRKRYTLEAYDTGNDSYPLIPIIRPDKILSILIKEERIQLPDFSVGRPVAVIFLAVKTDRTEQTDDFQDNHNYRSDIDCVRDYYFLFERYDRGFPDRTRPGG